MPDLSIAALIHFQIGLITDLADCISLFKSRVIDFRSPVVPHLYPAIQYFKPFSNTGHNTAPYSVPVIADCLISSKVVSDHLSAIGARPPYIHPYPAHRMELDISQPHLGNSGSLGQGIATISPTLAIHFQTLNPVESPKYSPARSYCFASFRNEGNFQSVAKSAILSVDCHTLDIAPIGASTSACFAMFLTGCSLAHLSYISWRFALIASTA